MNMLKYSWGSEHFSQTTLEPTSPPQGRLITNTSEHFCFSPRLSHNQRTDLTQNNNTLSHHNCFLTAFSKAGKQDLKYIYVVEISCQLLNVLLQFIRSLQAILEETAKN